MGKRTYNIPTGRLVYNNEHGKKITEKEKGLVRLWILDKITLEEFGRKAGTRRIPVKNGKPGKNSPATSYILIARTLKTILKENNFIL